MRATTLGEAKVGGALLFRLIRSLGIVENSEMRCCGVTTGQGLALLALKTAEPLAMCQVTEALGVSAGTATRVIDNLVRDGLAERTTNPADRRNVCVRPTVRGEEKIKELEECYRRSWNSVFGAIPKKRLPEVISTLELLVDAVEMTREKCCAANQAARAQAKEGVRA